MLKRWLKWLLWTIGGLFALLVVAIGVLVLVVDPNDYRDEIVAAVEQRTGRSFAIEGDIEWSLFPWLAVAAGPVTLGNDPAFPGDEFLQVGRLSASVRLWPLLSGDVEIGDVQLREARLDLQVDAQGRGNWESLAAAPADPATESEGQLSIQSISLTDSRLSLTDLGSGDAWQLENLRLTLSPLIAGRPMDFEVETAYRYGELTGGLIASGEAAGILGDEAISAIIERLELDVATEPTVQLRIDDPATLDLGADTLDVPTFELRSHSATGKGAVRVRNLTGDLAAEGTLTLEPFDLQRWLSATGLAEIETTDPAALEQVALTTRFVLAGDTLSLADLQARLDDTRITGKATAGNQITFELTADQLNVDRYLPPDDDSAPAGADEPVEIDLGRMRGTVRVDQLQLAGLSASGVTLTLQSDENGLRLLPIQGQLYGGAVDGEIALSAATGMHADVRVKDVQSGDLLAAWTETVPLTGLGDLTADLRIADPFGSQPLRSLDGSLAVQLRDGAVYGINLMSALRQVLALAGRGGEQDLEGGDRRTDYSSLALRGTIRQGVLKTDEFQLAAPYLRVQGDGAVDLAAGELDYQLTPTLVQTPEGQESASLEELEGRQIPLRLTGSLDAPRIVLDARRLLLDTQGARIEEKLREEMGLEPGSDEGKSSLEGLLQEALERKRKGKTESDEDGSL